MERHERIKDLRERKGLTQEEVAELVGCSKGYVSQIENKVRKPSIEFVEKFSEALHVSTDYIHHGVARNTEPDRVEDVKAEYGGSQAVRERRLAENADKRKIINKVLRILGGGNRKVIKALLSNIDAFLPPKEAAKTEIKGND